jgi:hypothetical protein
VSQRMEFTLKVGETAKIKKTLMRPMALVYAGEVSDTVFSLVVVWTSGYNSAAHNLYFSKNHRDIEILGGRLIVLELSSRHIRFQFEKGSAGTRSEY